MQFKLSLPIMRLNICRILNYIKYLIVIYTNSFSNRTDSWWSKTTRTTENRKIIGTIGFNIRFGDE